MNGNYIWAKQFSGTGFKSFNGMVVDASGNIFTAGIFSGTVDFDPTPTVRNLSGPTYGDDNFISKLDEIGCITL